jgi:hypothetical protein
LGLGEASAFGGAGTDNLILDHTYRALKRSNQVIE